MEDCSTDGRLQQETLCRRQWTDEYVVSGAWQVTLCDPIGLWQVTPRSSEMTCSGELLSYIV